MCFGELQRFRSKISMGEYDWMRKTCKNLYACMDISENDHGLIDLLMALYTLQNYVPLECVSNGFVMC